MTALGQAHPIEHMHAPATLDGGDVLCIGQKLFVGRTSRTNQAGFEMLEQFAKREHRTVVPVDVHGCLHLKTACTYLGRDTIVLNPNWVTASAFGTAQVIEVDPTEPFGANTLNLGEAGVLASTGAPRTADRLRGAGFSLLPCDIGEFEKAEAELTCLSVILS